EDRMVLVVLGPDADGVAGFQERRLGLAAHDRLDGANLRQAGIAHAAIGDRLARAAIRIAVRYRARSDDRARAQLSRLGGMGDQRAEVESHVLARLRATEGLAVE